MNNSEDKTVNTISISKHTNTGDIKSIKLGVIISCLILVVLSLVLVVFFVGRSVEEESTNTPTVAPSLVASLPTVTITAIPTNTVIPTSIYSDTQKYILTGCEIELFASSNWIPAEKGELGACGILSTEGTKQFRTFTDYPGVLIAILPFKSESIFTPKNQKTYQDYLKSINNRQFDSQRDFLRSQSETKVSSFPAIETEIYNANLGETKQIFYQGLSDSYIIVWGGQKSKEMEEEILQLISSIKPLVNIVDED